MNLAVYSITLTCHSIAKWPLDERRFNMLLTPYVYMSADGRRHIQDVKFNETDELSDDAVRPANTTVSNFVNANLTHPNLTTPEILDAEKDFAAKSFVVSDSNWFASSFKPQLTLMLRKGQYYF